MNLLAIETATERISLSLQVGEKCYQEEQYYLKQAEIILPLIDGLLKKAEVELVALDGIVFGRGPGSFTGVRLACCVAKGLALPHNLPLYPVSSLMAIAHEVKKNRTKEKQSYSILSLMDARMQQVYWAYFSDNDTNIEEVVSDPKDINIEELDSTPLVIAGVGFEPYLPFLPEKIKKRLLKTISLYPSAIEMLDLVKKNKINPVDIGAAAPVYIRNKVAYENK